MYDEWCQGELYTAGIQFMRDDAQRIDHAMTLFTDHLHCELRLCFHGEQISNSFPTVTVTGWKHVRCNHEEYAAVLA